MQIKTTKGTSVAGMLNYLAPAPTYYIKHEGAGHVHIVRPGKEPAIRPLKDPNK